MLILTRRFGEKIIIDNDIVISVLEINGIGEKKVSIGVDAPRSVEIHREEVFKRITQKKD